MTPRKPLSAWQESNTPPEMPHHIRRNIVEGEGGCWAWSRSLDRDGYGWASLNNKTYQAHRLIYTIVRGEIPEGLVIDHLCRVRHCVNPAHLEVVTNRENLARSELTTTGMKTCVLGHPLSELRAQRRCLTCSRDYEASRRGALRPWASRRPFAVTVKEVPA